MLLWAGFMVAALYSVGWIYYFAPVPVRYHFAPYLLSTAALIAQKLSLGHVDWIAALVSGVIIFALHIVIFVTKYRY